MGVDNTPEPRKKTPTTPNKPSGGERTIGIDPDDLKTVNVGGYDIAEMKDKMRPMLEDSEWKQPSWLKRKKGAEKPDLNYEYYYQNSLRARYLDLEGDFRSLLGNYFNSEYMDFVIAQNIAGYLQTSKTALESDESNLEDVVVMLNKVDQSMVWLYPRHYAKEYAYGLASELKGKGDPWGDYLADELNRPDQTLGGIRAALERTKKAINQATQESIIASGLQVERLQNARRWGLYVLLAAIVFIPMLIKTGEFNTEGKLESSIWQNTFVAHYLQGDWARLQPWAIALCAVIFGAGGAFFSSLMTVRTSRVTLQDYREKLNDGQLKMAIGGVAALILMTFLSYDIVPGITITNAGGFLFLAFVSGFSERYFLRLLNIEDEAAMPTIAPPNAKAMARPSLPHADAGDEAAATTGDNAEQSDVNSRKL